MDDDLAMPVGLLLGGGVLVGVVVEWLRASMLPLPRPEWASVGATLFIIGASTLFSSMFVSAMSMERQER